MTTRFPQTILLQEAERLILLNAQQLSQYRDSKGPLHKERAPLSS